MRVLKNIALFAVAFSFSSSAFAMEIFTDKSMKFILKKNLIGKEFKKLSGSKNYATVKFEEMAQKNNIKQILETPIIRKDGVKSYPLPKNFFMEKEDNVTVKKINERLFYLHRGTRIGKEFKKFSGNKNYVTVKFEEIAQKNNIKQTLETPIIRKDDVQSYPLPKNFFMEKEDNVTVKKINERLFHLHRGTRIGKENFIREKNQQNKQRALLTEIDGKIIDRRTKVKDFLSPQYLPICYIAGYYKISDEDYIEYGASGFRNSLNQVITAGHNVVITKEDIDDYFKIKGKKTPKEVFSFDKNFLTLKIIFGYKNEQGKEVYSYVTEVGGKYSFTHPARDLGIIKLPKDKKSILDDNVGSLPITQFPDQPHEYTDKNISIVGYPGELKDPALYYHTGPVKYIEPNKVVVYAVDTTEGNSGSPGLIFEEKQKNSVIPVCLTHTNWTFDEKTKTRLNAGSGYDQDSYDFMAEHIN